MASSQPPPATVNVTLVFIFINFLNVSIIPNMFFCSFSQSAITMNWFCLVGVCVNLSVSTTFLITLCFFPNPFSIKDFSKSYYPPRSAKVQNIINLLNKNKQKKFTLSGCLIVKIGNYLSIKKEA